MDSMLLHQEDQGEQEDQEENIILHLHHPLLLPRHLHQLLAVVVIHLLLDHQRIIVQATINQTKKAFGLIIK